MPSGTSANSNHSEQAVAHSTPRSLIKTGDLILTCDPWVWCLQWQHYEMTCAYCWSEPKELFTCTGCKLHRYCGKKCQNVDWKKEHKRECSVLKDVAHRIKDLMHTHKCETCVERVATDGPLISASSSAILMAKIMTKVKLGVAETLPGLENKSPHEIFGSFPEPHALDALSDAFRELCPVYTQLVAQYIPPLFPNVYDCIAILHDQGYRVPGQGVMEYQIGRALFPHVSLKSMEAVCWDSNVTPHFQGRRLFLWATADIADYTGLQDLRYSEQLHRYFHYTKTERRALFQMNNGSRPCKCRKCTAAFEAEINPLKCITAGCVARIPSNSRALEPCEQCGAVNANQLKKFRYCMEKYDFFWQSIPYTAETAADNARWLLLRAIDDAGILHADAHLRFVCGFQQIIKEQQYEKDYELLHGMIPCVRTIFPRYHIWRAHCLISAATFSENGLFVVFRKNLRPRSEILSLARDMFSWAEEALDIYGKLCGEDSLLTKTTAARTAVIKDNIRVVGIKD